jgi:hypothetical protein
MSDFQLYFQLGVEHIADIQAYDHLLFIVSLCLLYTLNSWKKVLILVTAFTIGHSITLALSALNLINVNSDLIEFLIPLTIIATCLYNLYIINRKQKNKKIWIHYLAALLFGLIHGMGFANYLKSLIFESDALIVPLFSFNIGIELGQIVIVLVYFILLVLISSFIKINHKIWVTSISFVILLVSIGLILP